MLMVWLMHNVIMSYEVMLHFFFFYIRDSFTIFPIRGDGWIHFGTTFHLQRLTHVFFKRSALYLSNIVTSALNFNVKIEGWKMNIK